MPQLRQCYLSARLLKMQNTYNVSFDLRCFFPTIIKSLVLCVISSITVVPFASRELS